MKLLPILLAVFGISSAPAAFAQGCCGGGRTANHAGSAVGTGNVAPGHEGHGAAVAGQTSATPHVFMKPVQDVFDNYIKAQGILATDSIDGLGTAAATIAQTVRGDSLKRLPTKVAEQADALGKAKDLESARAAYKTLSESLVTYLKAQKISAGSYYVAYCPMAKARWIQTQKVVVNPYMGKSMIHCGQIQS